MEDLVVEELRKELNWRERIMLKIFKKYTYKIYGIAGKNAINNIMTE